MESLGFDESAFDSSVRPDHPQRSHVTTTVETVVGKHTKKGVEGLWDSTVIDAPTLEEWRPAEMAGVLQGRGFRWTTVVFSLSLVIGLGFGGYWLYQRPSQEAASAAGNVSTEAGELIAELAGVIQVTGQLAAGTLDADYVAALSSADDSARELFTSSAALSGDQASLKSGASQAASAALADTQRIRDAMAYRMSVESALIRPDFVTDPGLTTIPEAAFAFSEWRSSLEDVANRLPSGVSDELDSALESLLAGLASAQPDYTDALAADDGFEANRLMTAIDAEIDEYTELIGDVFGRIALDIDASILETRLALDELVG